MKSVLYAVLLLSGFVVAAEEDEVTFRVRTNPILNTLQLEIQTADVESLRRDLDRMRQLLAAQRIPPTAIGAQRYGPHVATAERYADRGLIQVWLYDFSDDSRGLFDEDSETIGDPIVPPKPPERMVSDEF